MEGWNQFSIKPQALDSFHGLAPNIDDSMTSTANSRKNNLCQIPFLP